MKEFEKRAILLQEEKYTFLLDSETCMAAGFIGHLRADMDSSGNGFFFTWFDFNTDIKTADFKAEIDTVINGLREEGDILRNREALAAYCYTTPQAKMEAADDYYGVRVDTDKYAYLLRLNPNKGEYNVYAYCYVKADLDRELQEESKQEMQQKREYSRYKLQWMLDHDMSFDNLLKAFREYQNELVAEAKRPDAEPLEMLLASSSFSDWLEERGFGGMLWPCFAEWQDELEELKGIN